jgi:hypothetical protein
MGSNAEAASDPVASPDESASAATAAGRHFDFTLPSAGNLYVRFFTSYWAVSCTVRTAKFGLYLDGAPVPNSAHTLPPSPNTIAMESVVVLPAGAGPHSVEARADCASGTPSGSNVHNVPTWTAILLGS